VLVVAVLAILATVSVGLAAPLAGAEGTPNALPGARPDLMALAAYPLIMPVTGMVESLIGGGCPTPRAHTGIDISNPAGTASEIHAAYAGFATAINRGDGYGLYVDIVHEYPGGSYLTRYAHLSSALVPPTGQPVEQGQVIGMMGSTGSAEIVHLHFELRRGDGSVVDLNPAFAPCRRQVVEGDPLPVAVPPLRSPAADFLDLLQLDGIYDPETALPPTTSLESGCRYSEDEVGPRTVGCAAGGPGDARGRLHDRAGRDSGS
jgi:murein DD-endopeptidase MepM/ murein hydrolase activator NlpD